MRAFLAMTGVVLLAACGGGDGTEAPASTGVEVPAPAGFEVIVTDAFVMVPLEGRNITMGGATLEVSGQSARLIAADGDFAEAIELHTMAMEGDTMRMRKVEAIDLIADQPFSLERGADHFMVFGVSELEAGRAYPIRLTFELEDGTQAESEIFATARSLGD
ncbi:MAG: copper chaperone PCu(A)C [Pseudomonadota bacterium]